MKIFYCEVKRRKEITPSLCAICPRIMRCRAFRLYFVHNAEEYLNFVTRICNKFPDKYKLEVIFMPEKKTFVQIVDQATQQVERVASMTEINALSAEEKLALAREKTLYVVTHRLEPVVKVEMKKVELVPNVKPSAEPEKPFSQADEEQTVISSPGTRGRKKK